MPLSTPPSASPRPRLALQPHTLFLILGLLFGLAYCVAIPYGAGFDEEEHVVRIFDIAGMNLLPNRSSPEGTPSYGDFILLSYQRRYFLTPAADLFSAEKFSQPIDRTVTVGFPTRSIYPPLMFAPQAVLARFFWRKYAFPVIPVAILLRMTGLAIYLLGAYLTIRLLPLGKWVFTVLALAPMALFQAATLNADGFSNAVSFLLIGLTLNIAADPQPRIRPWKMWAWVLVCLLVGAAKQDTVLLLPLLALLPWRKFPARFFKFAVWGAAAVAVLFMLGWTLQAVQGSHFSSGGSQSIGEKMQLILANPLDFGWTFVKGNLLTAGRYFTNWVGVYGHGAVPPLIYGLFPLALAAALLGETPAGWITRRQRLYLLGLFVVSSVSTAMLYYYANYLPGDLSNFGRQGRYFIHNAPMLYLPLAGLIALPERWRARMRPAALGLLGLTLACYSWGLYATYYTYCGASVYTGQACMQPAYKNLDLAATPGVAVNAANMLTQSFSSVCGELSAVEVYVRSAAAQADGALEFTLRDGQGQVVAAQAFPAAQVAPQAYLKLAVPAGAAHGGDFYSIELETGDAAGFEIAASDSDHYREGELAINGAAQSNDLIFRYTCQLH